MREPSTPGPDVEEAAAPLSPAWKWHPPFPKLAGAPHPQLNQMRRRQWRWGQTGVSVPKRGRKEGGVQWCPLRGRPGGPAQSARQRKGR